MNRIVISSPVINGNRIDYNYEVEGDVREAFNLAEKMFVEYSIDVTNTPEGLAVIPLLANILPIAWIYDCEVEVNVCDKNFYECIPAVKNGYANMFPRMTLGGKIIAKELEENSYEADSGYVFFSGGVDGTSTLINRLSDKPSLVTVWGADVKLSDTAGWEIVKSNTLRVANDFELDSLFVKSNYRTFINESVLHGLVMKLAGDGWWHGFQHSIGGYTLVAPTASIENKKIVYFASTYSAKDNIKVTCASDPTIDNNVVYGSTRVLHDGYEDSRQDKVAGLIDYSEKNNHKLTLRVCWESAGGNNCCSCEKCFRTMLGIIAEKRKPADYGFDYTEDGLIKVSKEISKMSGDVSEAFYGPIHDAIRKNYKREEVPDYLLWFYDVEREKIGYHPVRNFFKKLF